MGESTAPAAARNKLQSDAGRAGNVAQASPDLGQVPRGQLVMSLAEQLGATFAESIIRGVTNAWWSVLQRMTMYDPEGDCEAPTAPAAEVAPSSWWLWRTSPSPQGRRWSPLTRTVSYPEASSTSIIDVLAASLQMPLGKTRPRPMIRGVRPSWTPLPEGSSFYIPHARCVGQHLVMR